MMGRTRACILTVVDRKAGYVPIGKLAATAITAGMGEVSCQIMIAELRDLSRFQTTRELAAWAGLTPCHFVSGTSGHTTTPITKVGSPNLRRALFTPAKNARVFNPLLKEFGDRLMENGKKPKQVIVAIMRKLLHQIFGILKSGQPYNPAARGFRNAAKA